MKLFVYGTLQKKVIDNGMLELLGCTYIGETKTINKYPMFINEMNVPELCNKNNTGNRISGELWEVNNILEIQELERGYFLSEIETESGTAWVFMKSCPYLKDKKLVHVFDTYIKPTEINLKDLK